MTIKEKAVKIIEEMINLQEEKNITFEDAGKEVKRYYNLTDKQFAGILMLALG